MVSLTNQGFYIKLLLMLKVTFLKIVSLDINN